MYHGCESLQSLLNGKGKATTLCYDRVSPNFIPCCSKQVRARADETGSSSLVYLANTLREVTKIAHDLLAVNSPRTVGGNGKRPGVVVEYNPEGEKALRLRLAVPEDGAVAP